MRILCGDIGGTNARLLTADVEGDRVSPVFDKTFPSHDYASFDDVIDAYLQSSGESMESVCFAIAGPVKDDEARVTNLPWTLNRHSLQQKLSVSKLSLINDFSAIAHGVNALEENDFRTIQEGSPDTTGPRVFVGAGTGLGVAQSLYINDNWQVQASQGGHIGFSPANSVQRELLQWMSQQQDYVSNEDVLSGNGLVNLYRFYADSQDQLESDGVQRTLSQDDPAAAISRAAVRNDDPIARDALDQFVVIYGSVAGNLALVSLAFGGVYLAGGIAPKIADQLDSDLFRQAFLHKGPMTDLTPQFPVQIILNDKVGLMGAALYAWQSAH